MTNILTTLIIILMTTDLLAQEVSPFSSFFKEELEKLKVPSEQSKALLILPNDDFTSIINSNTLSEGMNLAAKYDLVSYLQNARAIPNQVPKPVGQKKKLTLVIVPGVFGEFIKNRAFEDVLEKDSKLKKEFENKIASETKKNNPNAIDQVSYLHQQDEDQTGLTLVNLDKVVNVSEFQLGLNRVNVALLVTPFGSLESLGDARIQAMRFNRRLEKFIELMSLQDNEIALVGYSRGTPLALEMLAQAHKNNKSWAKQVRGVVSLSGVVWGSSLADEAVSNPSSQNYKNLVKANELAENLKEIPDGANFIERTKIVALNIKEFFKLFAIVNLEQPNPSEARQQVQVAANIDMASPLFIVNQMWKELGLMQFFTEYNRNIVRFKYLIEQTTLAVKELSTNARLDWWKSNTLPTENVVYYSLSAVMADPKRNSLEESIFKNPFAYGQGSYDDEMLLTNHREYKKVSGVELNDSQVSVVQASFLPKVIASLNPANSNIKTKNLGTLGTHHWGIALREVNKMKQNQVNGFPREALLKSIGYQILNDTVTKK